MSGRRQGDMASRFPGTLRPGGPGDLSTRRPGDQVTKVTRGQGRRIGLKHRRRVPLHPSRRGFSRPTARAADRRIPRRTRAATGEGRGPPLVAKTETASSKVTGAPCSQVTQPLVMAWRLCDLGTTRSSRPGVLPTSSQDTDRACDVDAREPWRHDDQAPRFQGHLDPRTSQRLAVLTALNIGPMPPSVALGQCSMISSHPAQFFRLAVAGAAGGAPPVFPLVGWIMIQPTKRP